MIRLTFLLRRKPELSRDEFQSYWRLKHGPLVASFGTALAARRYVQVHTIDDPANQAMAEARGGMEEPYDGVAEMWWENEEVFAQANQTSEAREAGAALLEDERQFIDLPNSPLWLNYEYPQVNPTPENIVTRPRNAIVKLYFPLRHRAELGFDEAQLYWRTNHGPIIRSGAGIGGMLRYVQVHRFEHPAEEALRKIRGTEVDSYTGHAEVWVDRRIQGGGPESRESGRRAIEDESKFIDFKRSSMWYAKEHVFVDHVLA